MQKTAVMMYAQTADPIEKVAKTFVRSDFLCCKGECAVIIRVFEEKPALGSAAAEQAGAALRRAILDRGQARVVAATGASQLEFLDALTRREDINWQRVEMFHL